jgi:hypothetical protein
LFRGLGEPLMNAPQTQHPTRQDLDAFAVGNLADAATELIISHLEACLDCLRVAENIPGDSFVARLKAARSPASPRDTLPPLHANTTLPALPKPRPASPHDPLSRATMPPITTAAALMDALSDSRILEPHQLEQVSRALQGRSPDARTLARELVKDGLVTSFQANQLLQGRATELVLGPYLLVDRLGEGGMGQVFKARHQLMNRIVALKVIRKQRLSHPDAVQRFHREIRLAAQLDHPHIV